MTYSNYIKAFEIFDKYENNGELHAEHDEIYGGPSPALVSTEDLSELDALGWSDSGEGSFMRFT